MSPIKYISPSNLLWLLVLIVLSLFQVHFFAAYSLGGDIMEVIAGDGRGYYDYLTSVFIDNDLPSQPVNGRYIVDHKGFGVNKYFAGTALLMLPFFILGVAFAWLLEYPIDGFSLPFQCAMVFSSTVYTFIGLHFVFHHLRDLAVRASVRWLMVFSLLVGTNLLYYSSYDLTASHLYSFSAIAAFLYFTHRFLVSPNNKTWLLAAATFGLIVLIRPVNGLILFAVPFIAGQFSPLKKSMIYLLDRKQVLVLGLLLFGSIATIQPILYWVQTGDLIVWSYEGEGFYFSKPQILPFLFSFKRGWLVYTPIFLLLIPSLAVQFKVSRYTFFSFLIWFVLTVYVLSSWWDWRYGGSFGARPMIDFYAVLIVPMAIWLDRLACKYRILVTSLAFLFLLLNVSQTQQMASGVLSSWHMNAQKYWWTLGKIRNKKEHAGMLGGRDDAMPFHQKRTLVYEGGPNDALGHWNEGTPQAFDSLKEYGLQFNYMFRSEEVKHIYISMNLSRVEAVQNAASHAFLTVELLDEQNSRKHYDIFRLNDRPDLELGKAHSFEYGYNVQPAIEKGDHLEVYVWNQGLKSFEITDAQIRLYAIE